MANVNRAPRYCYIAPLYKQAKQVAWDMLKHYTAPIPGRTANEAELRVDLPNGARIQLFGADNPDSLRGIYLDGVVLDEYAQMSPSLFSEVIRPALADRKGWAIWIGTPAGKNAFYDLFHDFDGNPDWMTRVYRASETGIIDKDELAAAQSMMSPDEYAQEFECSWSASIKGAYYSDQIKRAEDQGRICNVPWEPQLKVDTWWDLGVSDATTIIFTQDLGGRELRLIDYYESSGEGLAHYAKVLQGKPYLYGTHHGPHDLEVRELGTGKSRKEMAASMGLDFDIVPNIPIVDGIEALKVLFNKLWIDKTNCKLLLTALRSYHKEWDEKRQVFQAKPCHDWASHAADAARYMAVGYQPKTGSGKPHLKGVYLR